NRKTNETDIRLELELDGRGNYSIDTGCGFLDHMLELFACHGRFDLALSCRGDLRVDGHHTVEDVGIALGQAFREALGDKRGIARYGSAILPMDEALVLTAADFSGRAFLGYELTIPSQKLGSFDTELTEEFWQGFTRSAACSLHIRQLAGRNSHHIIECAFKSAARSLAAAAAVDESLGGCLASTKGAL
ncbi:MAG: imidazoleglycerol-phosphate dehydratase HisB, partial [Clostridia bacterium]|nr:imidazoleglycerol-phosphate dehydratase HisB [Clostridia bacterium]